MYRAKKRNSMVPPEHIMRAYIVIPLSKKRNRPNMNHAAAFYTESTEINRRRAHNWATVLRYNFNVAVVEVSNGRVEYYKTVNET